MGSRSGRSIGIPSGSKGQTAATQSSPACCSITLALQAGSVPSAMTMLFKRRGSAAQYSAMYRW